MPKWDKFRAKLDNKQSENNIGFTDMRNYLKHLGFEEHSRGGHFIYRLAGTTELINLQPDGNKCKAYQVAQVVAFLERNGLYEVVMVEKYTVVIWWSEEYGHFLASVPDLPGCLADGATQAEALAAIQRVASEWIDVATEAGIPIPCPTAHVAPELARAA